MILTIAVAGKQIALIAIAGSLRFARRRMMSAKPVIWPHESNSLALQHGKSVPRGSRLNQRTIATPSGTGRKVLQRQRPRAA